MREHEPIAPPSAALLPLEARAWLEFAALLPAWPVLRGAPAGDGHPVLVLPGWLANDTSTRALRWFLRGRGYHAHGWRVGRNYGPSGETVRLLVERFHELRRRHDRRLTLIGWSLGGIYARELARAFPPDVRQVITLATPFRDIDATSVARLYRAGLGPRPTGDPAEIRRRLRVPLTVPTTSFYSRSDGIVAWRSCLIDEGPLCENVEVRTSHCGMGHHPSVLLAIAERLAHPEGGWRPLGACATRHWSSRAIASVFPRVSHP